MLDRDSGASSEQLQVKLKEPFETILYNTDGTMSLAKLEAQYPTKPFAIDYGRLHAQFDTLATQTYPPITERGPYEYVVSTPGGITKYVLSEMGALYCYVITQTQQGPQVTSREVVKPREFQIQVKADDTVLLSVEDGGNKALRLDRVNQLREDAIAAESISEGRDIRNEKASLAGLIERCRTAAWNYDQDEPRPAMSQRHVGRKAVGSMLSRIARI